MIAILGVTSNDILYFRTKMRVDRVEKVFGGVEVYIGKIFPEDAVVAAVGISNYQSVVTTSAIIARYDPYLIIALSIVHSVSKDLRQGDLCLVDRVYLADIDYSGRKPVPYGQIPGMPPFFLADSELLQKAEAEAYLVTDRYIQHAFLLSSNVYYTSLPEVEKVLSEHYRSQEGIRITDNAVGGIAMAAHSGNVPAIYLMTVGEEIGNPEQKINWVRKGLEAAPTLGKIVTRMLLDTGDSNA